MNMQTVVRVNNVICERIGTRQAILYGRKITMHKKVFVTNHILTGKFKAIKLDKAN